MSDTPRMLSLTVPETLALRLESLAERQSQSLDAVLLQALEESTARWEDYYAMAATLASGTEPRLVLDPSLDEALDAAAEPVGDSAESAEG